MFVPTTSWTYLPPLNCFCLVRRVDTWSWSFGGVLKLLLSPRFLPFFSSSHEQLQSSHTTSTTLQPNNPKQTNNLHNGDHQGTLSFASSSLFDLAVADSSIFSNDILLHCSLSSLPPLSSMLILFPPERRKLRL